jgi:hypothetical protein
MADQNELPRRLESPAAPVTAAPVIARSVATKQSRAPEAGDCFVAALLAMTGAAMTGAAMTGAAMTGGVSGQLENALAVDL